LERFSNETSKLFEKNMKTQTKPMFSATMKIIAASELANSGLQNSHLNAAAYQGQRANTIASYRTPQTQLVGGFNHLEKYEFVNVKDYPIYYGK